MQIGDRIRALRVKRNMSQQELAAAVGCSRPAVVLWETGTRRIPLEKLRKVAKVLRSPISDLLGEPAREGDQLTEPAERELLALYRQMPPQMREKYLELFIISAVERKPRHPPLKAAQGHRVADRDLVEHAA